MSEIFNLGGRILVVGSLAFDHTMSHVGSFKDAILPGNYNISLPSASRQVFHGGCGGNIAYSLSLLGERPVLLSQVGRDFDKPCRPTRLVGVCRPTRLVGVGGEGYGERLSALGIDVSFVARSANLLTACAFIVTDEEENQVTIFDAGAMHGSDSKVNVSDIVLSEGQNGKIRRAIIAPDKPSSMLRYAKECDNLKIPYIFDPGQQITLFGNDDLISAICGAEILIVNEYEGGLLAQKLGASCADIAKMSGIYIETRGAKGAMVQVNEREKSGATPTISNINAIVPVQIVDPTGSGDAFRAGLLVGLQRGFAIEKACRVGALIATYSLECAGTQCHFFTVEEFADRYKKSCDENF